MSTLLVVTIPTTSVIATTTATATVDMATVATDHSELHTNATPTENLIAGIGDHGNNAQPHLLSNQQHAVVPTLPPPPHVNRTHNIVTNATQPVIRSSKESPASANESPRAPPRKISPPCNADSNNENDLMSFESVSSQLIAAANQNPFPTHKPYPSNMLANEIPPLSAANQPQVHSSSLFHSHANAATTNSNPHTSEDDLIVLDTLKAADVMKMRQKLPAGESPGIGVFEQNMIIVDSNDPSSAETNHSYSTGVVTSAAVDDKSNPQPRGVTGASHSCSTGVVTSTAVGDKSYPHPSGVTDRNPHSTRMVTSTTTSDNSYPHPWGVTGTNPHSTRVVTSTTMSDKFHPHPWGVTGTIPHSTGAVTSTTMSNKCYPHPWGVTGTGTTANRSAAANSNAQHSAPQQHLDNTTMASPKPSNWAPANQLLYRDGFGVSQSDVFCVEAIQMWVKAEMSLAKGDMAVALLAYQQVSGEH